MLPDGISEGSYARSIIGPSVLIDAAEGVVADIQRRHRPDGGNAISTKVGTGLYSHLLALGKEGSDNDGSRNIQLFAAEVCFAHTGVHRDRLAVAKGDGLQRPDGGNAISTKVGSGLAWHLLALREEGSEDNGASFVQVFPAEVCLSHRSLHRHRLALIPAPVECQFL